MSHVREKLAAMDIDRLLDRPTSAAAAERVTVPGDGASNVYRKLALAAADIDHLLDQPTSADAAPPLWHCPANAVPGRIPLSSIYHNLLTQEIFRGRCSQQGVEQVYRHQRHLYSAPTLPHQ